MIDVFLCYSLYNVAILSPSIRFDSSVNPNKYFDYAFKMHKLPLIALYHHCPMLTCIQASVIPEDRALVEARQAIVSITLTSNSSASAVSATSILPPLPRTIGITSNDTNAAATKIQVPYSNNLVAGTSAVATPSGTSDPAIASSCLNNDISTVIESWQSYTVCLHDLLRETYSLNCLRVGYRLHDKPAVCCST